MKKLFLVLSMIASIVASFILCELALNLIKFHPKPAFLDFTSIGTYDLYTIDSDLVFKVSHNQFRSKLKPVDKNQQSIAFAGDSATYSYGAASDATYPILFEQLFKKNFPDTPVVINNFGTPGYGIDQEYLQIKNTIIPQYKPKLIVWNLNVNDIWDNNYMCLFTEKDHKWVQLSGKRNLSYWYGWMKLYFPKIISNSKTFNFLWQRIANLATHGSGEDRYTLGCSSPTITFEVQNSIISRLKYFINDLKLELGQYHGELVVTLIPYQAYFDKNLDSRYLNPDYSALDAALNSSNVKYINFSNTGITGEKNPANELFLDGSIDSAPFGWRHPNQDMYKIMAQSLFSEIYLSSYNLR